MRYVTTRLPILLTFVITIGACNLALALDYYVNNETGDDQRDGRAASLTATANGPFRTISKALQTVRRGDRILLAKTNTPYRESITLQASRHSGSLTQPFIFEGNGALLDGTSPISERDWQAVKDQEGLYRYRPRFKSHHMFYINGTPAQRIDVDENANKLPELKPLQWCLDDGFVYFRVEDGQLPDHYQLSVTNLQVGITLYEARHIQIRNLTIQGFRLDGVNAHDSVFDANLLALKCRGNGRSGISIGGASRVKVEHCLLGNNGRAQLRTEGQSRTVIVDCDLVDTDPRAPPVVKTGGTVIYKKAGVP